MNPETGSVVVAFGNIDLGEYTDPLTQLFHTSECGLAPEEIKWKRNQLKRSRDRVTMVS